MAGQADDGGAAEARMPPDSRCADGRVPRARGLPGERRDLHGRRRAVRPALRRFDSRRVQREPAAHTVEDVAEHWTASTTRARGTSIPARPHGLVGRVHRAPRVERAADPRIPAIRRPDDPTR
jgi:hypothetical protein